MKNIRKLNISEVVKEFNIGDYVLATKYSDCATNDPWYVGEIHTIGVDWKGCFIQFKETGVRRWENVKKITKEEGDKIIECKNPNL